MKAVWETGRIETEEERKDAVEFAAGTGFDTIVTQSATREMVSRAHDRGLRVIVPVFPYVEERFRVVHPGAVQQMRGFEEKVRDAVSGQPWVRLHGESFRWQTFLLTRPLLCFAHPEARNELRQRVGRALDVADGIAFDGFGFNNYYACFCERCEALRVEAKSRHPDRSDVETMADVSSRLLVDTHRDLCEHAKSIAPEAVVTNHVWPKFLPDEYIGARYPLDFCTQTVSWFYPPEWRLERVEAEAAEHKRLEDPAVNRFVPFIGIVDMPGLVRTAERLAAEIDIALRYGEGRLVLSRLSTLRKHPALADAVREKLAP